MKIVGLEAWLLEMKLDEPYEIAYQRYDVARNVFLRLVPDRGPVGLGCAAPEPAVSGETPEGVLTALRDRIAPAVKGADPLRRLRVLDRADRAAPQQPAALAALDMALWDLLAKLADLPLYRLLGGYRDRMRTSITIGILPAKETVQRASERKAEGYLCLKLKGGLDPEEDADRVLRVRQAVGERVELRFDGNQGYSVEETLRFVELTRSAGLRILEQPTREGHRHVVERVRSLAEVALMADESLKTLTDAFRIARGRLFDMINLKLMKVGGIEEALRINSLAASAGLQAMVGCMDESALAIAAGLSLALARKNVRYADLDGHLGLEGDPAAGCVRLRRGILRPSSAPGLGLADLS